MLLIIHSWNSGFQNSCRRSKNKRETTFNRTRSGVSPALPLDWNQQLTKSRVRQKMKHKFSDSDWLLNKFHGCWCFSILQPLKLLMKNKLDNLSARLGKGSLDNFETIFVVDSTSGIRTICSDTFFLEHRTRFLPHRSFLRTTSRALLWWLSSTMMIFRVVARWENWENTKLSVFSRRWTFEPFGRVEQGFASAFEVWLIYGEHVNYQSANWISGARNEEEGFEKVLIKARISELAEISIGKVEWS